MGAATLLALADGRLPNGAHAHSYGVEASCATGEIHDTRTLQTYVATRAGSTGVVEAAFAAWVCATLATGTAPWAQVDDELAARLASPVTRAASRSLGRQLLRTADRVWPSGAYADARAAAPGGAPLQPIALGAVARAAHLSPTDAATASIHGFVTGMTTAAVRLLGLDPFVVAAVIGALAPSVDRWAAAAAATSTGPLADLPAHVVPLADVLAEHHTTWEVRLFAS